MGLLTIPPIMHKSRGAGASMFGAEVSDPRKAKAENPEVDFLIGTA